MTAIAAAPAVPSAKRSLVSPLILAGGVALAVGVGLRAPGIGEQFALTGALCVLAWIASFDSRTLRAPNRVVYPLALAATAAPFAMGIGSGLDALGGGALSFVLLLVAVLAGRGAMGYGDVKVGYVCGALVGVANVLPLMLATFAVGGAFALAMLAVRLRGRKDVVAFTPFLFIGTVLVLVLAGDTVYLPGSG